MRFRPVIALSILYWVTRTEKSTFVIGVTLFMVFWVIASDTADEWRRLTK